MRITHKRKIKMARKMLTQLEIMRHVNLFDSAAWLKRKAAIRERVVRSEHRTVS